MDQNPPPYGQQPPSGQPPYGQPQYGQQPYGQMPPYGQPPYGGDPYYYGGMAPKPGCIPLRPLGLGDILSGAFSSVFRNAKVVFTFSAVVAVVQALLSIWIQVTNQNSRGGFVDNSDPDNPVFHWGRLAGGLSVSFGGAFISLIVGAALTGVMIVVVTEDVVGRKATFDLVLAQLRARFGRLILLSVFLGVVESLGLVFCLAPGIWLWGIWAVTVPAMMVENVSFGAALGRSRWLVAGLFWRTWGIRALCYLIAIVASAVVGGIFGAILIGSSGSTNFHFGSTNDQPVIDYSAGAIIGLVIVSTTVALFVGPFKAAVDSLLYVDLRMRKEGLAADLQRAAAQR